MISLIGAAVLVVLVVSAITVWLSVRPLPDMPQAGGPTDFYGLGTGLQAGSSASPTPTQTASPRAPGDPFRPSGSPSPIVADRKSVV